MNDFFETICAALASSEAQKMISDQTKDIDNLVLKEAIECSMNVVVFGLVSHLASVKIPFVQSHPLTLIDFRKIHMYVNRKPFLRAHKTKLRKINKGVKK